MTTHLVLGLTLYLQLGAFEFPVSVVCDLHYTFMTVHLAILALDIGGTADATDVPDVFMGEGVEAFALL